MMPASAMVIYLNAHMGLPKICFDGQHGACSREYEGVVIEILAVLNGEGDIIVSIGPNRAQVGLLSAGKYSIISLTQITNTEIMSLFETNSDRKAVLVKHNIPDEEVEIFISQDNIALLNRHSLAMAAAAYESVVHEEVIAKRLKMHGVPDPVNLFPDIFNTALSKYEELLEAGQTEGDAIEEALSQIPHIILIPLTEYPLAHLASMSTGGTLKKIKRNSCAGSAVHMFIGSPLEKINLNRCAGSSDHTIFAVCAAKSITGRLRDPFTECHAELRICAPEHDEDLADLKLVIATILNNGNTFDTVIERFSLDDYMAGQFITIRDAEFYVKVI